MPLPDIPPGLERRANDALDAVVAALAAIQAAELARDGRYWQGLPTHAAPPVDGADVAPDRLDRKPTDRTQTWRDVGVTPSAGPVSLRCDEYLGPLGVGYVVSAEVVVSGRLWRRAVGVGPERRSHDWLDVTAPRDL